MKRLGDKNRELRTKNTMEHGFNWLDTFVVVIYFVGITLFYWLIAPWYRRSERPTVGGLIFLAWVVLHIR